MSQRLLPASKQRFGEAGRVVRVNAAAKTLSMADGTEIEYKQLLSTMPLDLTLRQLGKAEWADELTYSST